MAVRKTKAKAEAEKKGQSTSKKSSSPARPSKKEVKPPKSGPAKPLIQKVKAKTETKAKAKPPIKVQVKAVVAKAPVKSIKVEKKVEKTPQSASAKPSKGTPPKTSAPPQKTPAPKQTKPLPVSTVTTARNSVLGLKFLVGLAKAIKDAVAPLAREIKGREIVQEATSGDITFQIDRVAEKTLQTYLRIANLPLSYYSEDEGYSTFTSKQPRNLLIVDPIDGTRAAKNGFEGCVVSVASTRVLERPTVADIDCACVMDILGDKIFLAERGKGARYYVDNHLKRPRLSQNVELETMSWSMTIPARPAELIFPTAARIIDLSSLKGGFFACNSTSFSLTRLVSGQLDACVDVANRYYRDIPERVEDYFLNAGRGKVIGIAPYDMAGALLIAQEAGCIVTDAYGLTFDNLLLLDSSKGNHRSIVAAANMPLHEKLMSFFDTRIKQYEELLTRHIPSK
ncbi:MAG: hypothetical protein KA031_02305 [Candidatus Hydrogenedentes bacterium]|jgi:myo-inositol-1(or 4)-monophosphatase|nr:hypothetical protein [Candidatus Hydrogenedentota bacterium]